MNFGRMREACGVAERGPSPREWEETCNRWFNRRRLRVSPHPRLLGPRSKEA